jgi:hypothetical protein
MEGANAQPVLSGSDEVPEQFRKLVEQYYKSLSKGPSAPSSGATPAPQGPSKDRQ